MNDLPCVRCQKKWQARRDSNPHHPDLESGALPLELLACMYTADASLASTSSTGQKQAFATASRPGQGPDGPRSGDGCSIVGIAILRSHEDQAAIGIFCQQDHALAFNPP